MRTRALIALATALAAALSSAGPAGGVADTRAPALAPAAPDGLTRALAAGAISDSEYALARATALFSSGPVAARYGSLAVSEPRAATLVLRDLAVRLDELPPGDRSEAEALLARPDAGAAGPGGIRYTVESRVDCSANACVHWVESTSNAPPLTDGNGDTVPDQVELSQRVVEEVWQAEIAGLGYREPRSDESSPNSGPDGRIDVYLADTGKRGFYGYCTSDDPAVSAATPFGDVSAYCVLDDDFSPEQFPGDPVESLEATAAHEFFHAVQFAYDYFEDAWLMEGTAVWVEDEIYDEVDDHRQFLKAEPADPSRGAARRRPDFGTAPAVHVPVRASVRRHLSEWQGWPMSCAGSGSSRDAASGAPDHHSTDAIAAALEERGTTLRRRSAASPRPTPGRPRSTRRRDVPGAEPLPVDGARGGRIRAGPRRSRSPDELVRGLPSRVNAARRHPADGAGGRAATRARHGGDAGLEPGLGPALPTGRSALDKRGDGVA